MIEILATGITSHRLPTLADREQRTEDLLAQAAHLSRHGVATFGYVPGRGPFTTPRSATDSEDPGPAEEETAEPEELLQEET